MVTGFWLRNRKGIFHIHDSASHTWHVCAVMRLRSEKKSQVTRHLKKSRRYRTMKAFSLNASIVTAANNIRNKISEVQDDLIAKTDQAIRIFEVGENVKFIVPVPGLIL
ncbi:MAG: hypothetical protein A2277_15045 [Desulfobacterales bacterium RIFOXYA12_FULL_46_15]|nr:MAG: hypothetical protein A2277_15045 [Desulfobacterales bacterium RIFOXYA12_FULL_46_15]